MKVPYKLRQPLGANYNTDPEDVWATKQTLKFKGYYSEPDQGLTEFPDQHLFDAIKAFQRDNGLHIDGIMKPDGETEQQILNDTQVSYMTRCRHCGVLHGGVNSPSVCYQCWGRGLR